MAQNITEYVNHKIAIQEKIVRHVKHVDFVADAVCGLKCTEQKDIC
jgi:hypothetical protein